MTQEVRFQSVNLGETHTFDVKQGVAVEEGWGEACGREEQESLMEVDKIQDPFLIISDICNFKYIHSATDIFEMNTLNFNTELWLSQF